MEAINGDDNSNQKGTLLQERTKMTQHLTIYSPSPSTISYTVSSLSRPRGRISILLRHVIRVIFAFYAILALLLKAKSDGLLAEIYDGHKYGYMHGYIALLTRVPMGARIEMLVSTSLSWWVVGIAVVTLYLCLRRDYTEESLLVLRGLGVQTSTSSPFYLMNPATTFIPTTQIQDMVIHEAFKGFEVRFYLAIIVEGATEVVVVFPHLLPKRVMLEQIWRGSRKCLYGSIT